MAKKASNLRAMPLNRELFEAYYLCRNLNCQFEAKLAQVGLPVSLQFCQGIVCEGIHKGPIVLIGHAGGKKSGGLGTLIAVYFPLLKQDGVARRWATFPFHLPENQVA